MTLATPKPDAGRLPQRVNRFAAARPDLVLIAPYMTYLVLLGAKDLVPDLWQPAMIVLRGAASLAVVWLFRRHLPRWGRPFWLIAVAGGIFAGWGWVVGQYVFNTLGLPAWLPLFPGGGAGGDLRDELGAGHLFWTVYWLRLIVAITAVPVVEELFWRGFLLRALINWQNFERIPLGTFTWFSFLASSLLSTLQHPGNWAISILCWMLFNAVFYWTRSLLCLVLLHAVTNLVLYALVARIGDWSFL